MSTVVVRPERTRGSTEPATLLAGPYGLHRGKSAGWWGMVMVIFTETLRWSCIDAAGKRSGYSTFEIFEPVPSLRVKPA